MIGYEQTHKKPTLAKSVSEMGLLTHHNFIF